MSCRLFDRIINAMKLEKEVEHPSDTYESPHSEPQQPSGNSQTEPQDNVEYSEAFEEPSPEFQEAVNPAHAYRYQD